MVIAVLLLLLLIALALFAEECPWLRRALSARLLPLRIGAPRAYADVASMIAAPLPPTLASQPGRMRPSAVGFVSPVPHRAVDTSFSIDDEALVRQLAEARTDRDRQVIAQMLPPRVRAVLASRGVVV